MSAQSKLDLMADEADFRRLAMNYARAVDRHDAELFLAIFAEDAFIETPVARWEGHARLKDIPPRVAGLYQSTLHTVLNQTVTIDGDRAAGETYCIAYHLFRPEGEAQRRYDMAIRYQDGFVRQDGRWLFSGRKLIVDWTQTVILPVVADAP
jgi:uncharacterized protein (TIGR02246 family)